MSSSVLSASAKGATFLILLQVGSRALTFVVNQVLLRFLSPELLGLSAQLELYSITVLYFSRESLRVALQRQASGTQVIVNLSFLAIGLGIPLATILGAAYLRADPPALPYITGTLELYGLATVVELLSEPMFIAAQQKLLYKTRAAAETAATLSRCFCICGFAIFASRRGWDVGALPFATGQIAYAMSLLVVYAAQMMPVASRDDFSLLPKKIDGDKHTSYIGGMFSYPLMRLTFSLYIREGIKYILTQGDSILIAGLASLADQGAYALASNYGGLIARMLFQPIEESSRNLFAKLCSPVPDVDAKATGKAESEKTSKENRNQAKNVLHDILKFYSLISLFAVLLGPTLAPILLRLVAGNRWADTGAGETLAVYCYYIPLLAINGVTEAFIAAVATNAELGAQSAVMTGIFVAFAGAIYYFLRILGWGAFGLVTANCLNMLLRCVWNFRFIKNYFADFQILSVMPSGIAVGSAMATATGMNSTKGLLEQYGVVGELVRVGFFGGNFALSLLFSEREFFSHCYRMVRPTAQRTKAK